MTDSNTTYIKPKASTQYYNYEVTVVRVESIPASKFEWPADYTEIEIIPEMPDMEGNQQDGKKKKKKGGLSGMFKPDGR